MTGKPQTRKDYYERINKVLVYINNHLSETMELDHLASVSSYSAFHFHRIMRAYLGESIGSYIIRLRLDSAAQLLRYSPLPVNEIAMKVGYNMPSSFNKAFKKSFGVAPNEFRDDNHSQFRADGTFLNLKNMETTVLKPKIKTLKEKRVIYARAMGAYDKSAEEAWKKVCDYAGKNRLFGFGTEFIGISYDDPNITETEKLRYEACLTVGKEVKPDGEIGVNSIPGGKYAIFTVKGPYVKLSPAYDYIFGKWVADQQVKL